MTAAQAACGATAGVLAVMTLAACNSTQQVQFAEAEAVNRCAALAAEALGLPSADDGDVLDDRSGDTGANGFRLLSTGAFVFDGAGIYLKGRAAPVKLACTGDFNRRTISSVQVDGVLKRPVAPTEWTF